MVYRAPNGDHMQKLRPREVDVSTNHISASKDFRTSFSQVMFMVYLLLLFMLKRPFNLYVLLSYKFT